MKKEVIEDLLHTIQVILNWVVFENELTYLCFSAMCKEIKLIEKNADVMGRFIQEESHRKYEYNYFFYSGLVFKTNYLSFYNESMLRRERKPLPHSNQYHAA